MDLKRVSNLFACQKLFNFLQIMKLFFNYNYLIISGINIRLTFGKKRLKEDSQSSLRSKKKFVSFLKVVKLLFN